MKNIKLTDLIDVKILQSVQDSFSNYTGMAALTTDANGSPVTQGSGFTHFCMDMTRKTTLGSCRCAECDKKGALMTLEKGHTAVYTCHAGLVDYAAPIMVEGKFIGSFIGGQVRTEEVDEKAFRRIAEELGLDGDEYVRAAGQTRKLDREEIEKDAEFLHQIANILSEMAYNNYLALQKSRSLERAARSQVDYIMKMNVDMQNYTNRWMEKARMALEDQEKAHMQEALQEIVRTAPGFLTSMGDTVEYIKMTGGELELEESEYNIGELIQYLWQSLQSYARDKDNQIRLTVAKDVPERLLGDAGRLGQVISRLMMNSIQTTENGCIDVQVKTKKVSYASELIITITDNGSGMEKEELKKFTRYIDAKNNRLLESEDGTGIGLSVAGILIRQMEGKLDISSKKGEGTTYKIRLPQLEVRA